ncbi:hypothetical protein PanWU01x14_185980, partial [Parasponia andersonii]
LPMARENVRRGNYTFSKSNEPELTSRSPELILSIIAWGEFTKNSKSYTIKPDPEVGRTADKGMASHMMSDPDHKCRRQKKERNKREKNALFLLFKQVFTIRVSFI